jgi:hypothetical protein
MSESPRGSTPRDAKHHAEMRRLSQEPVIIGDPHSDNPVAERHATSVYHHRLLLKTFNMWEAYTKKLRFKTQKMRNITASTRATQKLKSEAMSNFVMEICFSKWRIASKEWKVERKHQEALEKLTTFDLSGRRSVSVEMQPLPTLPKIVYPWQTKKAADAVAHKFEVFRSFAPRIGVLSRPNDAKLESTLLLRSQLARGDHRAENPNLKIPKKRQRKKIISGVYMMPVPTGKRMREMRTRELKSRTHPAKPQTARSSSRTGGRTGANLAVTGGRLLRTEPEIAALSKAERIALFKQANSTGNKVKVSQGPALTASMRRAWQLPCGDGATVQCKLRGSLHVQQYNDNVSTPYERAQSRRRWQLERTAGESKSPLTELQITMESLSITSAFSAFSAAPSTAPSTARQHALTATSAFTLAIPNPGHGRCIGYDGAWAPAMLPGGEEARSGKRPGRRRKRKAAAAAAAAAAALTTAQEEDTEAHDGRSLVWSGQLLFPGSTRVGEFCAQNELQVAHQLLPPHPPPPTSLTPPSLTHSAQLNPQRLSPHHHSPLPHPSKHSTGGATI